MLCLWQMLVACDVLTAGLPEAVAAEADRAKWLRTSRSLSVSTSHPIPAGTTVLPVCISGAKAMTLVFHGRTIELINAGGSVEVFLDEARTQLSATVHALTTIEVSTMMIGDSEVFCVAAAVAVDAVVVVVTLSLAASLSRSRLAPYTSV